jgi:hypothetical protein
VASNDGFPAALDQTGVNHADDPRLHRPRGGAGCAHSKAAAGRYTGAQRSPPAHIPRGWEDITLDELGSYSTASARHRRPPSRRSCIRSESVGSVHSRNPQTLSGWSAAIRRQRNRSMGGLRSLSRKAECHESEVL